MALTRQAMRNFQDRISEVIDEFLLLDATPEQIREVLQTEAGYDILARKKELENA